LSEWIDLLFDGVAGALQALLVLAAYRLCSKYNTDTPRPLAIGDRARLAGFALFSTVVCALPTPLLCSSDREGGKFIAAVFVASIAALWWSSPVRARGSGGSEQ